MIEFDAFETHSFHFSLENHRIHDSLGFRFSACDITVS